MGDVPVQHFRRPSGAAPLETVTTNISAGRGKREQLRDVVNQEGKSLIKEVFNTSKGKRDNGGRDCRSEEIRCIKREDIRSTETV